MIGYLYITLGCIIVLFELKRYKETFVDYLTMFNIYFIGYYVVAPAVYNIFPGYVSRYERYVGSLQGTFTAFILVTLAYFCVAVAYSRPFKLGRFKSWKQENIVRKVKNEAVFFQSMSAVLLFIGVVALVLYSSMYGGVISTLTNAALIRDNTFKATNSNSSIEFVSRFIICLQYFAYLVYAKYLNKQVNRLTLLFALVMGALSLIIHAGRAAILTFMLVLIFSNYQLAQKKVKISSWIILGIGVMLGIVCLRPLLVSMSSLKDGFSVFLSEFIRRISSNSTDFNLKENMFQVTYYLEHKYVSLETAISAISKGEYRFDFFRDIFAAAVAIFPSAILPFTKPNSIDTYNTLLIKGSEVGGIVPPGGVAFGYYALGGIGVIIFSVIVGIVGKRLEIYFDQYKDNGFMIVLKTITMFVWVDLFINGELREWTLRYFVFLIIMIVVRLNSTRGDDVINDREI